MNRTIAALALLALTAHAFAADWLQFSPSVGAKKGSLIATDSLSSAVVRVESDGGWAIYRVAVKREDCRSEVGTVFFFNIGTNKLVQDISWAFAFGSGNVASALAEALCAAKPTLTKNEPTT